MKERTVRGERKIVSSCGKVHHDYDDSNLNRYCDILNQAKAKLRKEQQGHAAADNPTSPSPQYGIKYTNIADNGYSGTGLAAKRQKLLDDEPSGCFY